jgi:hypothetical protein
MRLIALVKDPAGIARFLRGIGEPTEPPVLAPARDPPYYKRAVRRTAPDSPPELLIV